MLVTTGNTSAVAGYTPVWITKIPEKLHHRLDLHDTSFQSHKTHFSLRASLRSCPLPIIPLCLSREEVAREQALLFGRAKRAARGRQKESLQPSLTNFHLNFAQTKGNTIGWKMTFRKLKLSDNRPSRPALNFRGKCRNTMLFSPKTRVMSAIAELTPKKKTGRGRRSLSPSVRDNCRLCGCSFKVKFGPQARHIGTENLFQPSKQKGSFGVILAKLCESVGLPVKYCEDKSDRLCSSCGRKIRNLHQLLSFVSSTLINSDNENSDSSEERFKRCLQRRVPRPIEVHWAGKFKNKYMAE